MKIPESIETALRQLAESETETDEGRGWMEGPASICTVSARKIAEALGGEVFGYSLPDDTPEAIAGWESGGHDFAVVGEFIIDYWFSALWGGPAVSLVSSAGKPGSPYLSRDKWEIVKP